LTRDEHDLFVSPFEKENEHTIVVKTNNGKMYVITKRYIGGGGCGSVFIGFEVSTTEKTYTVIPSPRYAIKQNIDIKHTKIMVDELKILEYMTDRIKCHPNVVCFYGWANLGNIYYIVMEYIDGVSLTEYVKTLRGNKNSLSILFLELLRGLSYIDSLGIMHRDIKPENILFTGLKEGIPQIKYVDFGLSCYVSCGHFDNRLPKCLPLTTGTPGYIDPELFEYESVHGSDVKINHDIFSLGATFYHLLTRKKPVSYDDFDVYSSEHANMLQAVDDALTDDEDERRMGELVKSMFSIHYKKRPTIEEAILRLQGLESGDDATNTLSKIMNKYKNNERTIEVLKHIIRYPKLLTTTIRSVGKNKIAVFKRDSEEQLKKPIEERLQKQYREILHLIDQLQVIDMI
jgi:serine/threonine protein kinase